MTTATETTKKAEPKAATTGEGGVSLTVLGLADIYEKEITIDPATGIGKVNAETFARTLPEGLTVEHIEKFQEHLTDTVAAVSLAAGRKSVSEMKNYKELLTLNSTETVVPLVGKDNITVSFKNTATVTKPGTDEKIQVYGQVRTSVNTYSTNNSGDYKKARALVSDLTRSGFESLNT